MSYFECFSVTISTIYCSNPKLRLFLCEIEYRCTLMKTRTAAHSWSWVDPHTRDSLFFVFPSDICCKIDKLLKYYEYQLTKHCLGGILEGFKVSSWFLKKMKLVKYRIAKKCHDFHHCCRWLHHHYSRSCHVQFYVMKQSLTLTTWF